MSVRKYPPGRVLSARDPMGRTTKFQYDALNRPTQVIDPLQGVTAVAYDPNGNLLGVTDARNNAISFDNDNMDRIQTRTDPLQRASNKFHNTGITSRSHDLEELAGRIQQKATNGAKSGLDPNVLAHTEGFSELGRFNVTRQTRDIGAFKTPTLRDVELTAPYMHNGSFKTLIDVVRFYNKGGESNAHLDRRLGRSISQTRR